MGTRCDRSIANCLHYIPDYNIGFKVVSPVQGELYNGSKFNSHSLVFVLEGEIEFSYDDFLYRRFKAQDLFFVPQSSEMFGMAITDAKLLVLTFNNRVESLCDRCRLSEYAGYLAEIEYDFKPLKITATLLSFAKLMEIYIDKEIKCSYLHELKQKELFVLIGAEYTERELVELFYPISGGNIDFRTRILENFRYGLDVSELAERFGMSYSPFLRRFKKEFGIPAQEWMLKQKAKHIKLRLSIHSTTVQDIIREFNFTDVPHFIHFCNKQYGCTPKELIKNIRTNSIEEKETK